MKLKLRALVWMAAICGLVAAAATTNSYFISAAKPRMAHRVPTKLSFGELVFTALAFSGAAPTHVIVQEPANNRVHMTLNNVRLDRSAHARREGFRLKIPEGDRPGT